MTVIDIRSALERRVARAPEMPTDMFVADLEARIIEAVAGHVADRGRSLIEAQAYARARASYLAHQFHPGEPVDSSTAALAYLGTTLRLLERLPPPVLARLRHPARRSNRQAQQDVIETALGIKKGAS